MKSHANGIMLLPAKSPETRWGQELLGSADSVLFLRGKLLFHYQDGARSTGKWSPYLLAAYGTYNKYAIKRAMRKYPGVLMEMVA